MAAAKTGGAEATLAELLRTKESLLRYGFTDTELAVAADSLISDLRRQVQEKDHHESNNYINYLTRYYLKGGNLPDVEWELDALQQLLPRIGAKDINAAIKNYFASDDVQVFIFAPDAEQESLPSDTRVRQMVAESRRMRIERPSSTAVEDRLLLSEPRRGEVVSGSVDNETGAVIWELGNGAKVILKPTENKNDEIVLQAMARGGTSSVSDEDAVSAGLAVEMMQVSGLGPLSRSELSRVLATKQVSFSQWINQYNRGFSGSTSVGDLKTLFEMLYLTFTDPRIDPDPVSAMMSQYETSLAHRGDNPGTVFFDEVRRTIYGNNPRFKALELADLPKVDADAALAFIRRSLNPTDYTFVFTGNLTDTMRDYVETYIGSIPPGDRWNEWRDLNITRPGKVERNVYKGREEQSRVYMAWFTSAPFTEELNAAAQVLNEYLDIRLNDEIREKLGGVYSIGVNVSVSYIPRGELSMGILFACDPGRVEELSAAVINLLNQTAGIAGGGAVNQDTFTKAVEALKKEWETSIQGNSYIAQSYANSSVLLNAPLSRLDRRPRYYTAVTPADIRRVCAQLLQGNNGPARVVLLPER
jgi:zinc protease